MQRQQALPGASAGRGGPQLRQLRLSSGLEVDAVLGAPWRGRKVHSWVRSVKSPRCRWSSIAAAGSLNRPPDVPGGFAEGGSASIRRALEPFHAESKAAHATLLRSDFGLAPAKWDVWGTEFRLLRGVQQEYANASANLT